MWTIIILIVLFIIGKFLYDRNKQSAKITKEGGMLNKYKVLIDHLLAGDSRSKIYKVSSDAVDLGLSSAGGTTAFHLTQTFGKITIEWKVNSPVFGLHELDWEFLEYDDQEKMFARISNDINKYQNNVFTAQGFDELAETPKIEKKAKHTDLSTVSKADYERTIEQQILKEDYTGALLTLHVYSKYYPEAKELSGLKAYLEEKSAEQDGDSDSPF